MTHVPLCTNANCQTFPVMTSFNLIGKQSFMGKNDSFSNFWGNSFNFYRAKRKQQQKQPQKNPFYVEWHTLVFITMKCSAEYSRGRSVGHIAHLRISLTKKSYFKKKERRTKDKLLIEV